MSDENKDFPSERKSVRRVFVVLPLVLLWIGSLVLGVGGAIPYGGSNGALDLFFALTWLFFGWVAFSIASAIVRSFLKAPAREEDDAAKTPESVMVVCAQCRAETPLEESTCIWCEHPLNELPNHAP